jgi:hypothetical protein
MARPRIYPFKQQILLRLSPEQSASLGELARMQHATAQTVAMNVLNVGLTLMPITKMALGSHALVPVPCGTLLCFALGPKDAARAERLIETWEEK